MARRRIIDEEPWSGLRRQWRRSANEEAAWVSELAREVGRAAADRFRRANRSACRAAGDVEGELYELNREIADLTRGALRARADRRRRRK
ncbi:hypothetical protein ACWDSJ_25990 [Nocardia sp. NPDC003482]